MNKIITAALIGAGQRGRTYTDLMYSMPDKYKVTAVCDIRPERAASRSAALEIPPEETFVDENAFFEKRRAELLIVATQDQDHVDHAIKGLALGYDILTEKPISNNEADCRRLLEAQQKYGGRVFVCHVLRYAPAFMKVKELLRSGVIGDIVMIDSIEQVFYFHQAHSYVRGNWRRFEETSPMIIAKCCHDLDLLQWYAESLCDTVSSIGDLRFFTPANKPEGAADRCTECKLQQTCPYSAVTGYDLDAPRFSPKALTEIRPMTKEAVSAAVKEGPYGRCVFACDNNVVDNQITTVRFQNGITATLRMTAFTAKGGRIMKFYGTYGELVLDESEKFIEIKPFAKPVEHINIKDLTEGAYSHGGGDAGMIKGLYGILTGAANRSDSATLVTSLESHLMGFAAERSRLSGGMPIKIEHN